MNSRHTEFHACLNQLALISALFLLLAITAVPALAQQEQVNWQGTLEYEKSRYIVDIPYSKTNAQVLGDRFAEFSRKIFYLPVISAEKDRLPLLSLGYFASSAEAMDFLKQNIQGLSGVSIRDISPQEHELVTRPIQAKAGFSPDNQFLVFPLENADLAIVEKASPQWLSTAQQYYREQQYELAASYYLLLAIFGTPETAAWAQELMGLNFERMRKPEMAISAYALALERFPDASGTSRIEQRMRGLQTAAIDEQQPLRQADVPAAETSIVHRGSIGQFYRTLTRQVNDGESDEVLSLLSTNFDLRSSIQNKNHRLLLRLDGFWSKDFLDNDNTELRLRRMNLDYLHTDSGLSVRAGRLKDYESGEFVPYDGISISYPLMNRLSVSFSGGTPYYYSDLYDRYDYEFYSGNIKLELTENWNLLSYYNHQTMNGIVDREAIGLQTQFNSSKFSSLLSVDYDTAFAELNNLLWNSTYNLNENVSFNVIYGKQRSPFLTTTNILIGQPDLDIEVYLQSLESTDILLENALARTSINEYISLSFNARLTEKLRLYSNYYDSTLKDIPNQDYLNGTSPDPQSSLEYKQKMFSTQLTAEGLFFSRESTSFGYRYNQSSNSDTNQVFLNSRIRVTPQFFVAPKITFGNTQYSTSNEDRQQLRMSMQLNYSPVRLTEVWVELGYESLNSSPRELDVISQYIFAGYRISY